MTTLTAPAPTTGSRRLAVLCCVGGGLALVADTVGVTLADGSFDPLDSVLFLAGLVLGLVGLVAAALALTAGRPRRALTALGVLAAEVVVVGLVAQAGESLAHALYHGTNAGLRGEWAFFLVGLQLLGLAGLVRSARRPAPTGADAA